MKKILNILALLFVLGGFQLGVSAPVLAQEAETTSTEETTSGDSSEEKDKKKEGKKKKTGEESEEEPECE